MLAIQRVYDNKQKPKGRAFLVDRIWPRGIKRDDIALDGWPKGIAPSNELRKWFHHNPERWDEFKEHYFEELNEKPEEWKPLLDTATDEDITLLYSSKDREHNNAVVLKEYLEERLPAKKS